MSANEMNMPNAVRTVLGKYVTFSGRASRPEFWWYYLFLFLLYLAAALIEGMVIHPMMGFEAYAPEAGQPLQVIIALALFLPTLAVAIRRLHDIDRSGWWYLVGLIPIIGTLVLLWWFTRPSSEGPNRFG